MLDKPVLRFEIEDGVAVLTLDNPPVNAVSYTVRAALHDAIARLGADPSVRSAVLIGAGRSFVAGSDISEFGRPIVAPDLPAVIAAIEACPKPILAALNGAALGGGFELALGCDARIAKRDAVIGLPEVTLGMIPGAGGTQRLPRLVGLAKAMRLIVEGTRLPADEALALGLVDAVVDGDLRREAIARAKVLACKSHVSARAVPLGSAEEIDQTQAALLAKARGRDTVISAIAAIRTAGTLPLAEALAAERATFQRLRLAEEAMALRHLFFAERAALKYDARGRKAPEITTIGVAGGGTMGSGIAASLAAAGYAVTLFDTSAAALERARGAVAKAQADLASTASVSFTDALAGIASANLVIEAVFEDMAVKSALLAELGRLARPETILASNTSYLDLDALAQASGRPERVLGLHFFAPAHRMKLLEVVEGYATAPETMLAGLALARRLGKQVVIARVGDGFIGNRIFARYRQQGEFLIEEGATPEAVDAAARSLGFAMGPFAVSDLSGLDIAWRNRQRLAAARDPRERYVTIADRLCEAGRLGRKTGAGWYDYAQGESRGTPSATVAGIIEAVRPPEYRDRPAPDARAIGRRLLVAIANEAALVLSDGIARSAGDIDVALVSGYGFSRFKGGPLFQASLLAEEELQAMISVVAAASGVTFRQGDIETLLAQLSQRNAIEEQRN